MKTRLRRWLGRGAALIVVAFVFLCFPFDPPKWTANEIGEKVDLLNEKAAVLTPHMTLGEETREANLALFEKVEKGQELTPEESAAYRVLYQSILKDNQSKLALLDSELTVLTNYKPADDNNVGTHGIEGSHDHHDASSSANLAVLRQDLETLEQASGLMASYTRVRAAISAYKDVNDVILHMATAPQTKSVHRAPEAPADDLQERYEAMMLHFKRAQFEPVNSPAYAGEVHRALDSYAALVVIVQDRVYAHLGPLERSLSGRWATWRSLSPSLRGVTTDRIPRATPAARASE